MRFVICLFFFVIKQFEINIKKKTNFRFLDFLFFLRLSMKNKSKRIQLIYRMNTGEYRKFWQIIDFNNMITLQHVWNNINQELVLVSPSNNKYEFYYYKTKQKLPEWYHVELLNDNDQILIEDFIERYYIF